MNRDEYGGRVWRAEAGKLLTIERPEEALEKMVTQLTDGLGPEELNNLTLAYRGAYVIGKAMDVVRFIGKGGVPTRHDVAMLAPKMLAGSDLELPEDYGERRRLTDMMIEQGLMHGYLQENKKGVWLSIEGIQDVTILMMKEVLYS